MRLHTDGVTSHASQDDPGDTLLEGVHEAGVEGGRPGGLGQVFPPRDEVVQADGAEGLENKRLAVELVVDDGVGTGVEGVCGDDLALGTVELGDDSDYSSGDVIEVEDWGVGIEADGV